MSNDPKPTTGSNEAPHRASPEVTLAAMERAGGIALVFGRWVRSQGAVSGAEPTRESQHVKQCCANPSPGRQVCTCDCHASPEPKAPDLADTFAPHDAERIAAYQRANAAPDANALDLADEQVIADALYERAKRTGSGHCPSSWTKPSWREWYREGAREIIAALRAKANT